MPVALRLRALVALPLLLVTVLLASSLVATSPAQAMTLSRRISIGWDITRHQQGDPYRYGADGPSAFDCSGLIYYSFRKAGFTNIPRTAAAQAGHMRRIKRSSLRVGDFVYFYSGSARAGNVYHVGVYAGWHNGRRTVIHAPRTGQRVHREALWTNRWFAGTLRGR
jgi:cell wall-associated NlpC family hydrolase